MNKKNAEGYSDPTAYRALSQIQYEENDLRKLRAALSQVCALTGYHIKGRITLVNEKTGHIVKL